MEIDRARAILEAVRDGRHPLTGEGLPPDDPCQHPELIRALFTVLHALDGPAAKRLRRGDGAPNAGQPWKPGDDEELGELFDKGSGFSELARKFGRSRTAIKVRLESLGRITADGRPRRLPESVEDPVPIAAPA